MVTTAISHSQSLASGNSLRDLPSEEADLVYAVQGLLQRGASMNKGQQGSMDHKNPPGTS